MSSGKCGDNLVWTLNGGTLTISGTGKMDNYADDDVNTPWYVYRDSIYKVIILYGVTSIGDWAFNRCTNLKEIKIPDSVTWIGNYAFIYCEGLKEIKIPESVTWIGNYVFFYCESLKEIKIPDSVTQIFGLFYACTSLEKIYYPEGRGFEDYLGEVKSARLIPYVPDKLRWKVEDVTLTVGGVRTIKYSAEPPWIDSLSRIQRIIVEDGVEEISAKAFLDCRCLEHLTIPASVKTIGDMASTLCYCGDRMTNGGRNVIWSLNDRVLTIKKNPAAKSDSDFTTGYEAWHIADKNIDRVKIERGVILGKRFYDWLNTISPDISVAFS